MVVTRRLCLVVKQKKSQERFFRKVVKAFRKLDLGCTRSIGSTAAIKRFQKHALYYGIRTEFCPCNKSFVFANSEMETCLENCNHFPTKPPCLTRVDVLETGKVSILVLPFSK